MDIGTITILLVVFAVAMFGLVWTELFFVKSVPRDKRQYTVLGLNEK